MGMPFYAIFVQLPQRFQSVNFTTAERAGILLLPISLVSPIGAMASGLLVKKMPLEFVIVLAIALVFIGTGLLSSLPTYSHIWPGTYPYEVITGLGLGLSAPPYYMLLGTAIAEKEISVGTGALNMFRTLGGCVAVAVCSAVHREHLNGKLPALLSPEQIAATHASGAFIARLPQAQRDSVAAVFGESYNRQFQVMLAFNGLNVIVIAALCILRKKAGVFGKLKERQEDNEFISIAQKSKTEQEAGIANEGPVMHDTDFSRVRGDSIKGNADSGR